MAVTGAGVLGGRYVLREVLGTGGMATVWRARDEVLGREVAVKVLSPQYAADPGFLARFEREARHAAAVSHPRLVTVFDSGIDRGTPFLVMELVTGRTLRQVLDEAGPLPAGQAVAVTAAVCEGLEAAHAAGLVHRDVKPANIMLARGEVKILDFGIARAGGTAAWTATGTVLGTAAYLSPEQAAGYPAGPQSDCVLFEMLAGVSPFTAESQVAIAYRQVHDDPGAPSARRPGLPASLDQITARLLAKDPAARPASAAAARAGLLAALAPGATAVLPVPPGSVPGAPRRWRRRRGETVLAAALGPRSRRPGTRPGRSRTCTPWAACCSSCSPASRRSPPNRRSRSPTGRCTMTPARRPGLPASLDQITARLLAKDPAAPPARTCSATCSRCCSARPARTPGRSRTSTPSSSRPTPSTSPKGTSPARQPPPCPRRSPPSATPSAPVNPSRRVRLLMITRNADRLRRAPATAGGGECSYDPRPCTGRE